MSGLFGSRKLPKNVESGLRDMDSTIKTMSFIKWPAVYDLYGIAEAFFVLKNLAYVELAVAFPPAMEKLERGELSPEDAQALINLTEELFKRYDDLGTNIGTHIEEEARRVFDKMDAAIINKEGPLDTSQAGLDGLADILDLAARKSASLANIEISTDMLSGLRERGMRHAEWGQAVKALREGIARATASTRVLHESPPAPYGSPEWQRNASYYLTYLRNIKA